MPIEIVEKPENASPKFGDLQPGAFFTFESTAIGANVWLMTDQVKNKKKVAVAVYDGSVLENNDHDESVVLVPTGTTIRITQPEDE